MSLFGWSLPPGCSHRQIEEQFGEEPPCQVCGKFVDECICPECAICGVQGDPECYAIHDLERSPAQLAARAAADQQLAAEEQAAAAAAQAEAEYWRDHPDALDILADGKP